MKIKGSEVKKIRVTLAPRTGSTLVEILNRYAQQVVKGGPKGEAVKPMRLE